MSSRSLSELRRDLPIVVLFIGLASFAHFAILFSIGSKAAALPYTSPTNGSNLAAESNVAVDRTFVSTALQRHAALIIDARSKGFYALGHIPGAINIPLADFDSMKAALNARYGPRQPVIVYCSSDSCSDSSNLASDLISVGYKNVFVYTAGWFDWAAAQLPVEIP